MRKLGRFLKRIIGFGIIVLICVLIFNMLNKEKKVAIISYNSGVTKNAFNNIGYDFGYDVYSIEPANSSYEFVENIIKDSDGVIFAGGVDIDPALYNSSNFDLVEEYDTDRDKADLAILEMAIKYNKPILGICRGLQLINVYYGASLYEDIPSQYNSSISHRSENGGFSNHTININESSRLFNKLKNGSIQNVNSMHHEAIRELADPLTITALADDGIIEMVENKEYPNYFLGVQWHPEFSYRNGDRLSHLIFEDFFEAISN